MATRSDEETLAAARELDARVEDFFNAGIRRFVDEQIQVEEGRARNHLVSAFEAGRDLIEFVATDRPPSARLRMTNNEVT